MIWSEVEEKYGKETADKMKRSSWLECITVRQLKNGDIDIPESDIMNAYDNIKGNKINWMRFD